MSDEISELKQDMKETRKELRQTQEGQLAMQQEVHNIGVSVESIALSVEKLVEVQSNMKLMEQRTEDRHLQLKEADKRQNVRIDEVRKDIDDGIKPKTLKYILFACLSTLIGYGIWVTLYLFTIDKLFTSYVAAQTERNKSFEKDLGHTYERTNENKNQITYLKGRIKDK